MKITDYYFDLGETPEQRKISLGILETLGCNRDGLWDHKYSFRYARINENKRIDASTYEPHASLSRTKVTFGGFVDMLLEKPTMVKVKLSSDYTAEVYKDRVVVGCQTVSKDTFDEIAAAMKSLA